LQSENEEEQRDNFIPMDTIEEIKESKENCNLEN